MGQDARFKTHVRPVSMYLTPVAYTLHLAPCLLPLATSLLLYNAILACANGPTIFSLMGVPTGKGGNPRLAAFEANPEPGTSVMVNASWLFRIGSCIVMVPSPVKDPSFPSPVNSFTSQMASRHANLAETFAKANDTVRPVPSGIWSMCKSVASASQVPSPLITPSVERPELIRWEKVPFKTPWLTYR